MRILQSDPNAWRPHTRSAPVVDASPSESARSQVFERREMKAFLL